MSGPVVGVFDSGFGGLTVLRALLPRVPSARWLYLGDTARLPYGSKSQETIARYAVSACEYLQNAGAQFLVIACNTASALALKEIRAAARVPVLGVIETGVAAALKASPNRSVLVLATAATVASHAYARAGAAAGLHITEKACPLLVPLVEEGWVPHPVTDQVVSIYLDAAFAEAQTVGPVPDTVLLGCTHYPLLREVFMRHVPPGVTLVDSAEVTAMRAAELLDVPKELNASAEAPADARLKFFVTDSTGQFQALGERFLGQPIANVAHVALSE